MKTRTGITRRALFSGLMAATMLVGVGCSSGGSSSGIGSNFSGNYSGVLRAANGAQIGTVTASLIDTGVSADADGTTNAGTVTGQIIVNGTSGCPAGGNVTGNNTFGRLQLTAGDMTVTLSPSGGGLSGLWSLTSGTTTTTGTGTTGTTTPTTTTSCSNSSGTIILN